MPPTESSPLIEPKKPNPKWKLLLIIGIVIVALGAIALVVWGMYAARYVTSEQSLYDKLEGMCKAGDSCCLSSVDVMRENSYKLSADKKCLDGYEPNQLLCVTSYVWCEPQLSMATTSDQFTNWLTYKNSEYGFEFKYPNGWTLIEGTSDAENYDLSVNYIESAGIPAPSYCQAKLSTDKKRCEGFNTDTGESIIVDWDYSMADIYHKTNGNYASIWFKEGKNDEQHKSEIRLVLSTFKFISTSTPTQ